MMIAMILGLGLLCSQLCNVGCAFAHSPQAKFDQPLGQKEEGHCHHQESPMPDQDDGPRQQDTLPGNSQPNDSQDCHLHDILSLLPVIGVDWLHHSSPQPDFISFSAIADLSLDHIAIKRAELTPFRPPPRETLQSVLRI